MHTIVDLKYTRISDHENVIIPYSIISKHTNSCKECVCRDDFNPFANCTIHNSKFIIYIDLFRIITFPLREFIDFVRVI